MTAISTTFSRELRRWLDTLSKADKKHESQIAYINMLRIGYHFDKHATKGR